MIRMAQLGAACAALSFCTLGLASELQITFGEDSLRAEFLKPVGEQVADSAPTLQAGALYLEEDEADGTVGHVGLVIYGDAGTSKAIVQAGVGGRFFLLSSDPDLNGTALALGGAVHGRLPGYDRVGAYGGLWYAPGVSSFGELERTVEFNFGVEYQLLRQAAITAGYRFIEFDVRGVGDVEFEDSAFIGLKFLF